MAIVAGPFPNKQSGMTSARRVANERRATVYLVQDHDLVGHPWSVHDSCPADQPSIPVGQNSGQSIVASGTARQGLLACVETLL